MKNILINLSFILLALMGCSNVLPKELEWNQLNRVDVQKFTGENSSTEIIIAEEEEIIILRELFARIEWEQNVKAEMVQKEDVKATLFFKYDKNMPERLFEYFIWFNQDDTKATIIDREKQALGILDREDTQALKASLMNN